MPSSPVDLPGNRDLLLGQVVGDHGVGLLPHDVVIRAEVAVLVAVDDAGIDPSLDPDVEEVIRAHIGERWYGWVGGGEVEAVDSHLCELRTYYRQTWTEGAVLVPTALTRTQWSLWRSSIRKTQTTPKSVIETCKRRLREYDAIAGKRE